MKKYIAILKIVDVEEIIDAKVSYSYRKNGINYSTTGSLEFKEESEDAKNKTYEDGLNEAWEVARKIVSADNYKSRELEEMFGSRSLTKIFKTYTASEAIEKIEKYEETNIEIKLGDEVESCGAIGVVVESPYDDGYDNEVLVLWANSAVVAYKKQDLKKTGRHFPQIEEVLNQMQEE